MEQNRRTCPDGGTCHHECEGDDPATCFRVTGCGPLSGVFPGDVWPLHLKHKRIAGPSTLYKLLIEAFIILGGHRLPHFHTWPTGMFAHDENNNTRVRIELTASALSLSWHVNAGPASAHGRVGTYYGSLALTTEVGWSSVRPGTAAEGLAFGEAVTSVARHAATIDAMFKSIDHLSEVERAELLSGTVVLMSSKTEAEVRAAIHGAAVKV